MKVNYVKSKLKVIKIQNNENTKIAQTHVLVQAANTVESSQYYLLH